MTNLPTPTPQENESKTEFIERCIQAILKEDPDKTQEQASAIAYDIWSKSKNARSLYEELTERFDKIRDVLAKALGKRGEALLNYTLIRLGVFDPSLKKFNMAALDGNMNLPFLKYDADGSATVGNLLSPPVIFSKIDRENKTVEGYANTIAIDTYADVFLPEAYRDSFVKEYQDKASPIYFMHHMDVPAGDLVELKFDNIGMYAKTKPYTAYWDLIEKGTLKGYSIGFYFKIWPDVVGTAYVTHKKYSIYGNDISYVTSPANLLSYFNSTPEEAVKERTDKFVANTKAPLKTKHLPNAIKTEFSQSQQMTDDNDLNVVPKNKTLKETEKLSEKQPKKYDSIEQCIADGKSEAECKTLMKSSEEKFVEKTTDELMKMSSEEQWDYMQKLAEHKIKIENVKKIRHAEEAVKEAAQVDRFKNFENMVAQLKIAIDELSTEVKSIKGTIKGHEEKMNKFENEVADIAVTPPITDAVVDIQKIAANSGSFGEFIAKVEKTGSA